MVLVEAFVQMGMNLKLQCIFSKLQYNRIFKSIFSSCRLGIVRAKTSSKPYE